MAVFLGAIKGRKKSKFPEVQKAFNKWLRGEWVVKWKENVYSVPFLEGWHKTFTKDEMFRIFADEFVFKNDGWRYFGEDEVDSVMEYFGISKDDE